MTREPEVNFEPFFDAQRESGSLPWAAYSAKDASDGHPVRLAVLWPPESLPAGRLRSVLDWFAEAGYQAQRLSAPALPSVRSYRSTGDAAYVATDAPTGRPLRERLSTGGPLPVAEAMRVSSQLAETLAQAHATGWAHGWLNPDTVYLDDGGRVTLVDLGLGLAAAPLLTGQASPWPTQPGLLVPDPRQRDMQCLGLLVAEMLIGPLPEPVGVPRADAFPPEVPPAVVQRVRALVSPQTPVAITASQWAEFARVGDAPEVEPNPPLRNPGIYDASPLPVQKAREVPWTALLAGLLALAVMGGGALLHTAPRSSTPHTASASSMAPTTDALTRVQVGPIQPSDEEQVTRRLKGMHFQPYIKREGDVLYLQVGAFANADSARMLVEQLRGAGFNVRVQ